MLDGLLGGLLGVCGAWCRAVRCRAVSCGVARCRALSRAVAR